MKRILAICLVIGCVFQFNTVSAQQIRMSDVQISLLTADPGDDLYLVFGHSAIRVKINPIGYDTVFNYGMFDFDQPNFYINFARGRLNYCLGTQSYNHFVSTYAYENRGIREQVFELDSVQTAFIVDFLNKNNQPENRHYMYHFFLDNCATRIRDLMLAAYVGLELLPAKEHPSYRELVYQCTQSHPWGRFLIDIALGLPTDQKTDTYEQMFLPEYMFNAFAAATHNDQSIIRQTHDVFIPDQPAISPPGPLTPMVVCCLVLALSLLFCFVKKGAKIFDVSLFGIAGLVGIVVFMLWFFTDHTNTRNNLNIIWALPTHFFMAFSLLKRERSRLTRKYFLLTAVISVLLLAAWAFLPQHLNIALIPLVVSIALRAFWNYRVVDF